MNSPTSIFFGVMFMAVAMVVFSCVVLLIYLGLSALIDRFIHRPPVVKDPPLYTYRKETSKEYPNE